MRFEMLAHGFEVAEGRFGRGDVPGHQLPSTTASMTLNRSSSRMLMVISPVLAIEASVAAKPATGQHTWHQSGHFNLAISGHYNLATT